VLDFGDMRTEAAFGRLFRTALLKAAFVAAQIAGVRVPRRFSIEIAGGDRPGRYDDVADASRALFRSDGLFYARIDLGVGEIAGERARARAVVAPGPACPFEATWNVPKGYGPFRLVRYETLASLRDEAAG
jgi:hypothetical protein